VDVNAVRRLYRREAGYPPLLTELHDPPESLFVRGAVEALSEPGVASWVHAPAQPTVPRWHGRSRATSPQRAS